jgi:hypothetical protein
MNKDELTDLEAALEDFERNKHQSGGHLPLMGRIAETALVFLKTPNLRQEDFFRRLLKNKNYHIKFLALYSLSAAQRQNITLQEETLEELKRIRHNPCPKMNLLFACLEKKLKAEQISSQTRR